MVSPIGQVLNPLYEVESRGAFLACSPPANCPRSFAKFLESAKEKKKLGGSRIATKKTAELHEQHFPPSLSHTKFALDDTLLEGQERRSQDAQV